MGDAVAALVTLLRGAGLSTDQVTGVRIPRGLSDDMPTAAVVVRGAGGGALLGGYAPEVDDRVDIRCYGATEWDARQLADEVSRVLHNVRDVTTEHGRVIWCRRSGGITDSTEPDTGWPVAMTSWQVYGNWLEAS